MRWKIAPAGPLLLSNNQSGNNQNWSTRIRDWTTERLIRSLIISNSNRDETGREGRQRWICLVVNEADIWPGFLCQVTTSSFGQMRGVDEESCARAFKNLTCRPVKWHEMESSLCLLTLMVDPVVVLHFLAIETMKKGTLFPISPVWLVTTWWVGWLIFLPVPANLQVKASSIARDTVLIERFVGTKESSSREINGKLPNFM